MPIRKPGDQIAFYVEQDMTWVKGTTYYQYPYRLMVPLKVTLFDIYEVLDTLLLVF